MSRETARALPLQITFERVFVDHVLHAHIEAEAEQLRIMMPPASQLRVTIQQAPIRRRFEYRARVELVIDRTPVHTGQAIHRSDPHQALSQAFALVRAGLCETPSRRGLRPRERAPYTPDLPPPLPKKPASSGEIAAITPH